MTPTPVLVVAHKPINVSQVVGIIDYMRQYDIIKRMERMGKSVSMIAGQAEPTIVQPSLYKTRFQQVSFQCLWGVLGWPHCAPFA